MVLLACGIVAALPLMSRYGDRWWFAANRDGCHDVPLAPAVTPTTNPDSMMWPYGAVRSCRVLAGGANLFARVDASYTVWLETNAGSVLARIDYSDINLERRYGAVAVELDASDFGLSPGEAATITQAIAKRGGRQGTPWILHYEDG